MYLIKELHHTASIVSIKGDEKGLLIANNRIEVFYYDTEYKRIYKNELSGTTQEIHAYSKAVASSKNSRLLVPSSGQNKLLIYEYVDTLTQERLHYDGDAEIETACFSKSEKLLAIGDVAGRCSIYTMPHLAPMLLFKPKPDYINTLSFSDDERYLIYSSFNKTTTVFDIKRSKEKYTFSSKAVVESILFLDKKRFMSAQDDGSLSIYDISLQERVFEKNLMPHWPSGMIRLNEQYVLVISRAYDIYFFNIESREIDFSYKMTYKGISQVSIYKNIIYFGFTNGVVQIIDIDYRLDAFEVAIKVENVAEVQRLCEENIFLKAHPSYGTFIFTQFDVSLQEAITMISQNHVQRARELMSVFENESRYVEFETYLKYAAELVEFYNAVQARELSVAFLLAHDFPILEGTQSYAQLEIIWNNTFKRAKALLQEDPISNYKRAENILRPFAKIVEKKNLIGHLFNNVDAFAKSEKAIKEQNVELYFKYISEFDFLKDTDIYNKMLSIGENIMKEMLDYESLQRFDKAVESAMKLKSFPMFKSDIQKMAFRIKIKKEFNQSVMDKRYNEAFIMMDKYDYIEVLPKAIALEAKLQADVLSAAHIGAKPKEILHALNRYIDFESCQNLIRNTLKPFYIQEMYQYASHSQIFWEKVFERFLSIYAAFDELSKFAKLNAKEEILEKAKSLNTKQSINIFPNSILIKKKQS